MEMKTGNRKRRHDSGGGRRHAEVDEDFTGTVQTLTVSRRQISNLAAVRMEPSPARDRRRGQLLKYNEKNR